LLEVITFHLKNGNKKFMVNHVEPKYIQALMFLEFFC
jgi:hypothetical protein